MKLLVWALAAATVILVILVWRRVCDVAENCHFVCPRCGNTLKLAKSRIVITPHFFSRLYLTCPRCRQSSLMRFERD